MYATVDNLISAFGLSDVTSLLADELQGLDADLLRNAIAGDLSAYSQDEQAAAAAALARAENVLNEQTAYIDGYLARRYRLPLTTDELASAVQLRSCCAALARCALADDADSSTEQMVDDRTYWNRWLMQLADGKTLLPGVQQISAGTGTTHRRLTGKPRSAVNWERY